MTRFVFQSTLPAREATWSGRDSSPTWQFQSTLPAGEATISTLRQLHMTWIFQSTLPAGEATAAERVVFLFREFQSTLPAGEATQQAIAQGVGAMNFNPRFPRGKRLRPSAVCEFHHDFNPRFPRGKRLRYDRDRWDGQVISIHASRGGSDVIFNITYGERTGFQSTLPAGEATWIHMIIQHFTTDFNPRFPRGKRRLFIFCGNRHQKFQSTLPAGEATE